MLRDVVDRPRRPARHELLADFALMHFGLLKALRLDVRKVGLRHRQEGVVLRPQQGQPVLFSLPRRVGALVEQLVPLARLVARRRHRQRAYFPQCASRRVG